MSEKKKTLHEMLTAMMEFEDDLIELTPEAIKDLLGDMKDKVDGIRETLKRMEATESMLADDIRYLEARKKALSNSRARMKEYMLNVLSAGDFTQLPGNRWDLKVITQKRNKLKGTADEADYINLKEFGFVKKKVEYSFVHAKLSAAFNEDPEQWGDYMEAGTTQFLKFNVRK